MAKAMAAAPIAIPRTRTTITQPIASPAVSQVRVIMPGAASRVSGCCLRTDQAPRLTGSTHTETPAWPKASPISANPIGELLGTGLAEVVGYHRLGLAGDDLRSGGSAAGDLIPESW